MHCDEDDDSAGGWNVGLGFARALTGAPGRLTTAAAWMRRHVAPIARSVALGPVRAVRRGLTSRVAARPVPVVDEVCVDEVVKALESLHVRARGGRNRPARRTPRSSASQR